MVYYYRGREGIQPTQTKGKTMSATAKTYRMGRIFYEDTYYSHCFDDDPLEVASTKTTITVALTLRDACELWERAYHYAISCRDEYMEDNRYLVNSAERTMSAMQKQGFDYAVARADRDAQVAA